MERFFISWPGDILLFFRENKMSDSRKELMKLLGDFSTIGLSLASAIFVGVLIGYLLDHKVFKGKTAPWLTLIFLGFGIAAGFRNLYRLTKRKDL
jgi:ATP synthase protein I